MIVLSSSHIRLATQGVDVEEGAVEEGAADGRAVALASVAVVSVLGGQPQDHATVVE